MQCSCYEWGCIILTSGSLESILNGNLWSWSRFFTMRHQFNTLFPTFICTGEKDRHLKWVISALGLLHFTFSKPRKRDEWKSTSRSVCKTDDNTSDTGGIFPWTKEYKGGGTLTWAKQSVQWIIIVSSNIGCRSGHCPSRRKSILSNAVAQKRKATCYKLFIICDIV